MSCGGIAEQRFFEQKLVHHCAPTLAGLKAANLFTCPVGCKKDAQGRHEAICLGCFKRAFKNCQDRLEPLGIRMEVLAMRETGPLIYVYRPQLVVDHITALEANTFLSKLGYFTPSLDVCLMQLSQKIQSADAERAKTKQCIFPHEIGLFLGYPYEDVVGFIENDGCNSLCSGCWKVYSKERDALECFCNYKQCTRVYELMHSGGVTLEELVSYKMKEAPAFALAG